jgi:hypothetical protein
MSCDLVSCDLMSRDVLALLYDTRMTDELTHRLTVRYKDD